MAEQELGSGVSTPKKVWLCLVADFISAEIQKVNERDDEGGQGSSCQLEVTPRALVRME